MGDAADDLWLQEYNWAHFPESHRTRDRGKFTFYDKETDTKYWFKTQKDADEWARKRGFRLTTTPPKPTNLRTEKKHD